MAAGTGYSSGVANAYQAALGSLSLDTTVNDGNNATGPDNSGSPPVQITVIIDMGADTLISAVALVTGWETALTRVLEWSTAGAPTTWTTIWPFAA